VNLVTAAVARLAAWVAILSVPVASWAFARTALGLASEFEAGLWEVADAVVVGAAGIGSIATGLLTLATVATLASPRSRPARRPSRLVEATPRAWRRVIAVATGAALTGGFAAPALAAEPSPGWISPPAIESTYEVEKVPGVDVVPGIQAMPEESSGGPALSPGWIVAATADVDADVDADAPSATVAAVVAPPAVDLDGAVASAPEPSRSPEPANEPTVAPAAPATPAVGPATASAPAPSAPSAPAGPPNDAPEALAPATARVHVVAPGESLWSISAAALGDDASVADIDAAWRALYAANSDAIGSNPDVIHPELPLTLPKGLLS